MWNGWPGPIPGTDREVTAWQDADSFRIRYRDMLPEHQLKGVSGTWQLFALED
jgi:hypothetical protein